MKISIITRCSRIDNILKVKETIFKDNFDIDWHIIFDTKSIKEVDIDVFNSLYNQNTFFHFRKSNNDLLLPQAGEIASTFNNTWVYFCDDDNIIHENFYTEIRNNILSIGSHKVIIVSQYVGGKDFTGLDVREALPENVKVQKIDMAQAVIHSSLFKKYKFKNDYVADGIFLEEIFNDDPSIFVFNEKVLSYYNHLQNPRKPNYPKVLYIGDNKPDLKTVYGYDYEAKELDVVYRKDDSDFVDVYASFNPDAIVTTNDWKGYSNLSVAPLTVRKKWIDGEETDWLLGEKAYQVGMNYILNNKRDTLISFFTPVYNTGDKLYNTYASLQRQTYNDWEWVIVNDSTDGGKTLKIAEAIAKSDYRVKVYDFRNKSNGVIGEVKYRAAMLCNGYLLAELDHDDVLTENCAMDLFNASIKHPEGGFFYTDCIEMDTYGNSLKYPEGFCFGYGKYRKEIYKGVEYDVNDEVNINPKTIRHIVGVPNHVRAWRRDVYYSLGGHNRLLPIADDYELVVRTFLETIMVKIPKLGYIQYLYNDGNGRNSHDLSRADIQRRVRTIMYHYNDRIAKRFNDLGLEDWCYNTNKDSPLLVESRFNEQEGYANIIYND